MKILITGVSGTGKSTICKALKERGIFAMDFSEVKGLCFWRNIDTKEKIVEYPTPLDLTWFDTNERICDVDRLKEILDKYDDIVITGVASGNHGEYLSLFDKVLLLQCSPETFVERIQKRDNPFGKTKIEQDFVLNWQKTFDPFLLSYGAIPINTEGSLDSVVEKIINQIK